jgi:hypothetical protein
LAVCVVLANAAGAQEIIKYRTPDGQVGFAQDASGVPAGATVLDANASGKEIRIDPTAAVPAAPAPAQRRRSLEQAIQQEEQVQARKLRESESVRSKIKASHQRARSAEAAADRACTPITIGRDQRGTIQGYGDCKGAREKASKARATYQAEREELELEGWDVEGMVERPDELDRDEDAIEAARDRARERSMGARSGDDEEDEDW